MAKKPEVSRKIPADFKLLSPEDRKALRDEARASILAEMKQDARDEFFREQMDEARRSHVPAEQIVHVTIDTAPYVPHIMLDGVQYFNGYGYDVERQRAIVLYEQMQRSWHHQDEIDGRKKSEAYRRPNNRVIGPMDQGTATRGTNGVITAEI